MSQSNDKKTFFFGNRKQMNQAFKTLAWLTVISLLAGSGVLGIKELLSGGADSGIANVNGLSIPVEEFKRNYMALNNFVMMAKSEYGANADMILQLWGIDSHKKAEDVVLEKLIQEKVVQSLANSFSMNVKKEYLDIKLHDTSFMRNLVPADILPNGKLNSKLLSEYLHKQNISLDDFESQITESIKKSVLLEMTEGIAYLPQSALKDEFIKKYSKRKYSVIAFNIDEYLNKAQEQGISDLELERYFKAHQESYRMPEKRHANFWIVEPKDYDIRVEDKEIADFFEKNKDSYRKENSSKDEQPHKDLADVRQEIINKIILNKFTKQFGVDVNRILIESKQSPAAFDSYLTNKKAKSLPVMLLTTDDTKQSQKIFSLNKLKDITFFVENEKGYIGELIKIDKSYIPTLKDVAEKVKQELLKEKAKELAEEVLGKLINNREKNMEEINSIIKGKLLKTDLLDPQHPETFKRLKDMGIRSDVLFNLEVIGQRTSMISHSAAFIIQLDGIDSINEDILEEKKQELTVNAKRTQTQNVLSDLIKNLEERATITINRKLFAQVLSKR